MKNLLKKIEEQEKEAQEFGFYWESINQILEQIQSEFTLFSVPVYGKI